MNLDINIQHLEYFVKVSKYGSINKAAQALYISQPYLGKLMSDLEEKVGVRLFNRSRSGVTLTPDGAEFLEHAKHILSEIGSMHFVSRTEEDASEPLMVSMTRFSHIMESFCEVVMRHKDQPVFAHHLCEGNTDEVIEDVASGRVNVGVFHFDNRKREDMLERLRAKKLEYHFLTNLEPHIVLSKKHPLLLENKPVNLHTLSEYGFLWYLGQCDDYIYQLLSGSGQETEKMRSKITVLTSRATLMYMISVSDCYSIGIHDFALQEASYQSTSIPIQNCGFMLEFGYVTPVNEPISDITNEFLADLKRRLS